MATTIEMPGAVELIPATRQALWGWPAVANFALGGLGAGLYVKAVVAGAFGPSPAVTIAAWLGPALVLAGFLAIATESGRPLRGPRVLTRVRTSWMSRELWLGAIFVALAGADLAVPLPSGRRYAGALAAIGFVVAQGFILREARAVVAWSLPAMPLLFLVSAAISGDGLFLGLEAATGRAPRTIALAGTAALLLAGGAAWRALVSGAGDEAIARSLAPLTEGRAGALVFGGAYVAPFLLVALASLLPPAGTAAAAGLAGFLMVAGQVHAKARLILRAGRLRPITLAAPRLHRRTS